MSRSDFSQWRTAFRNFVDCAASEAAKADCVAGWKRDAAAFLQPLGERKVDGLLDYYLDGCARPIAISIAPFKASPKTSAH